MKLQIPDKGTLLKISFAFLAPLVAFFLLYRSGFSGVETHSHALHSLVMAITGLLSFYVSYRTYRIYEDDQNPILLPMSLAFLSFGAGVIFHAIAVPDLTYLFNETIFDVAEHYGLFLGSLILLGILFPFNKQIGDFLYSYRRIFLYGLMLILLAFFISVISSPSLADFLETYINLPIGMTGLAFFLNAIFIFGAHDFRKERSRFSIYLMAGLMVLAGAGVVPFFYKEFNVLWWFFHAIFAGGFALVFIGLLRIKDVSEFREIFSHIPIRTRLVMNYLAIGALGLFALSFLNYYSAKGNISDQVFNNLALTSRVERENILNFFEYAKGRAVDFSSDGFIRDSVGQIINGKNVDEAVEKLNTHLVKNKMPLDQKIIGINVMDLNGKIIASTNSGEVGEDESEDDYFANAKGLQYGEAYMSDVVIEPSHFRNNNAFFAVSTVLTDKETHEPIGVIVNYYNASILNEIVSGRHGGKVTDNFNSAGYTKKTMEIFVANADGLMITESKFVDNAVLRQRVYTEAYWKCKHEGKSIHGVYKDYRNVEVVGASECLPNGWLLVTKIDFDEVFAFLKDIQKRSLIFGTIILSMVVLISTSLSRALTLSLNKLESAASKVAGGDLSARAEIVSGDEVGNLAKIFNSMVGQLQQLYEGLEQKVRERTKELADKVEEVGREKEKLSTILFGIGDGVFVIDNELKIILWNKIAEEISGFSTLEVLGKKYDKILKFTNEKTGEISDSFVKSALATGQIQQMANHTLLTRKDGAQIAVADSCAPLKDKNNNISGYVVIFRDATKERDVDRVKTEFVSLASHQLRTPLSAIRWYAEMLLGGDAGKLNKVQQEYMEAVDQSNLRMIDLVNALLNVSRIDMGAFAIDPKPTNFAEVAQSVADELAMQIKEKNIKFSAKYAKGLPLVEADPKLIRIIMQNLLSNAVKYTPPGGKVGIAIGKDGENILIKVSDTGYGIPLGAQNKIFTKLFRADNIRSKEVNGTGLGLYVVKSILNESGGKVWFESIENKGTTFYAAIPLAGMKKKDGNKELA